MERRGRDGAAGIRVTRTLQRRVVEAEVKLAAVTMGLDHISRREPPGLPVRYFQRRISFDSHFSSANVIAVKHITHARTR